MWKVKSVCLYTIAAFGSRCSSLAIPVLTKLFTEGSINKQTVAETLVKLGTEGERTLIKILMGVPNSNYNLKISILKALSQSDINSPNIDFIVETLYKEAKNHQNLIKKSALQSLKMLSEKSKKNGDTVTYLQDQSMIEFFYMFLKEKDPEIQAFAVKYFRSLEEKGGLVLTEGLASDPSVVIRCNCAIGLGELGMKYLRELLIGLGDESEQVLKVCEKTIMNNFKINNIMTDINDFMSQKLSLKINIKNVVESNKRISKELRKFLSDLLKILEREINLSTTC